MLSCSIFVWSTRSGIDSLTEIRSNPEIETIPIVVCSADAPYLRQEGHHLAELGCEILEKPFHLDDLLQRVHSLTGMDRFAPMQGCA